MIKYIIVLSIFSLMFTSNCFSQSAPAFVEFSIGKTTSLSSINSNDVYGDIDFNLASGITLSKFDFFATMGFNKFDNGQARAGYIEIENGNIFNIKGGANYKVNVAKSFQLISHLSAGTYFYKIVRFSSVVIKKETMTAFGISPGIGLDYSFGKVSLNLTGKYNYLFNTDEIKFFQLDGGVKLRLN